ncbi:MAG: hypothetical protein LBJ41_05010 [Treponema sp.]|jgi:hypothetical protein|nr:hypothetical protein [Treponema sp.]
MTQCVILATYLILFNAALVFPTPLNELLDSSAFNALMASEQETVTEVRFKTSTPALLPRHSYTRELVANALQDLDISFLVETLYIYHKPSGASFPTWTEAERSALFNQCLALSRLAGLEYYSESRKRMRTFYETSFVIDSPETKRPLPDPVYDSPPASVLLYARQKDLTFGDNIYCYEYHARSDALLFTQENLTTLSLVLIPAVGKNRLRSVVAVFDASADLLIYVLSAAKAASFPGLNERVGESFSNRADALLRWFVNQADQAFGR